MKSKRNNHGSAYLAVWNAVILTAILVIGVAYVFQITSLTSVGYEMRDLEASVSALELDCEQMDVSIAEATSLSNISERIQILGFEVSDDAVYLPKASSVAVRF